MHVGLIGGIGPAATDLYYRGLVEAAKTRGADLEMTVVHADAPTLLRNFEARQPHAQAEIFLRLTERLAKAGARAVALTSIGGHFCMEQFRPLSPLPVIDLIGEMDAHLANSGLAQVGILGTDTVMATRFYGGLNSVSVLVPPPEVIDKVHRAYVDIALSAHVDRAQRRILLDAGREMAERGAETVLLAGTDLFLAFKDADPGFGTLDCAAEHIEAIARLACGTAQAPGRNRIRGA